MCVDVAYSGYILLSSSADFSLFPFAQYHLRMCCDTRGELQDPYKEFMIFEDVSVSKVCLHMILNT